MTILHRICVASVVAGGVVFTGGSVDATTPEPPDPELATEGEPSDALIEDYVDSFAQADPGVGQALAEPDSPAWWMAMYQSLSTAAVRDAGVEPDAQTATVASGSVEICYEASDASVQRPRPVHGELRWADRQFLRGGQRHRSTARSVQ